MEAQIQLITLVNQPTIVREAYPVELAAESWPQARRLVVRFAPWGCILWEGTRAAYATALRTVGSHSLPWNVLLIEHNLLSLYARRVGGSLAPIACCYIVRPDRVIELRSAA